MKPDMASQKFPIIIPPMEYSLISVLTNYVQLLLYISYEQSDLYMLSYHYFLIVQDQGEREHTL